MRITYANIHLLVGRAPTEWMMDLTPPEQWESIPEPSLADLGSIFSGVLMDVRGVLTPYQQAFKSLYGRVLAATEEATGHSEWVRHEWGVTGTDPEPTWGILDEVNRSWAKLNEEPFENHVHISVHGHAMRSYSDRSFCKYCDDEDFSLVGEQIALENGTTILKSAKPGIALPAKKFNNGPPRKVFDENQDSQGGFGGSYGRHHSKRRRGRSRRIR